VRGGVKGTEEVWLPPNCPSFFFNIQGAECSDAPNKMNAKTQGKKNDVVRKERVREKK